MQKFSVIFCLLCFVFIFVSACTTQNGETELTSQESIYSTEVVTSNQKKHELVGQKYDRRLVVEYSINKQEFIRRNINVQYPKYNALINEDTASNVNNIIYEKFVEQQFGGNEEDLNSWTIYNADYQVMLSTSDLISIVEEGDATGNGGIHDYFSESLTIDLNTLKKLKLTDFVIIDENFVSKVKNPSDLMGAPNSSREDLIEIINSYSHEKIMKQMNEFTPFFVTENAIWVQISVPHLAGKYAWVKIENS